MELNLAKSSKPWYALAIFTGSLLNMTKKQQHNSGHSAGRIRITGGSHRTRLVKVESQDDLRPTGSRIREVLFNWLSHDIHGMTVLDLYAGSGILSFEALSRGAIQATLVDSSTKVINQLKSNCEELQFSNVRIYQQSVVQFNQSNQETFDLVFVDPPFAGGELEAIDVIIQNLTHKGSYIYREFHKQQTPEPLNSAFFERLKHKQAGKVCFELWQRHER